MQVVVYSVICLGAVAALAAVILYFVAKKFKVEEDPRIDLVAECLPGANCGGCGYPGCRGLAEAMVKASATGSIDGMACPAGGAEALKKIGAVLGLEVAAASPMIAVVRCGGTREMALQKATFDGPSKCAVEASLFSGEKGCPYGCLGLGDCVDACQFGALSIDKETGLPVVDEQKCTGCGACAKSCPRRVIEVRPVGRNNRRVFVGCRSMDKGAIVMKICKAACIGCGKCAKECPEKVQAITVENFLAYINPKKCIACGKCAAACPTHAIKTTFELPKPKPEEPKTEEPKTEEPKAES